MDIEKFVKLNDAGEIDIDKDAIDSMFTAEVNRAVEKYRNGKGKDEIRKQLEEEAKLTAEQKLKAEREEFEAYRQKTKIELNQAKARTKFDDKLFSQEEIDFILSTVNDNEETSLSKIDSLITARKKFVEESQKDTIQKIQQQQQKPIQQTFIKPDGNEPAKPVQRTQADVLSYYRKEN